MKLSKNTNLHVAVNQLRPAFLAADNSHAKTLFRQLLFRANNAEPTALLGDQVTVAEDFIALTAAIGGRAFDASEPMTAVERQQRYQANLDAANSRSRRIA